MYCLCTVCVLNAGRLLQVRRSPRKTGKGWGSGANGRLVQPASEDGKQEGVTEDGKQEGDNEMETATEGGQVRCFCVS